MSVIDTIDVFDKLEFNDLRSFAAATALIAKSIEEYNNDPSATINGLQLLYENEYVHLFDFYFSYSTIYCRASEITTQQKDLEREWLENNNEIM
jgi:hypothetical protein